MILREIGFNCSKYFIGVSQIQISDQSLHLHKPNECICVSSPWAKTQKGPASQESPSRPSRSACEFCHHRLVLPVFDLHMNGIVQQVPFGVGFLSLNVVFVRFNSVTTYICGSHIYDYWFIIFRGMKSESGHVCFQQIGGSGTSPLSWPGLPFTEYLLAHKSSSK